MLCKTDMLCATLGETPRLTWRASLASVLRDRTPGALELGAAAPAALRRPGPAPSRALPRDGAAVSLWSAPLLLASDRSAGRAPASAAAVASSSSWLSLPLSLSDVCTEDELPASSSSPSPSSKSPPPAAASCVICSSTAVSCSRSSWCRCSTASSSRRAACCTCVPLSCCTAWSLRESRQQEGRTPAVSMVPQQPAPASCHSVPPHR